MAITVINFSFRLHCIERYIVRLNIRKSIILQEIIQGFCIFLSPNQITKPTILKKSQKEYESNYVFSLTL